jgi:hypothetical protein
MSTLGQIRNEETTRCSYRNIFSDINRMQFSSPGVSPPPPPHFLYCTYIFKYIKKDKYGILYKKVLRLPVLIFCTRKSTTRLVKIPWGGGPSYKLACINSPFLIVPFFYKQKVSSKNLTCLLILPNVTYVLNHYCCEENYCIFVAKTSIHV